MTSAPSESSGEARGSREEWASGSVLLGLLPWYPLAAERPLFLSGRSSWSGHIPFAFWSVAALRPRLLVELGTLAGDSYLAFCQAIAALSLPTRAHAVDHWKGDEQAGFYGEEVFEALQRHHDPRYGRFSELHRMAFDDALPLFPDGSIDLLHIDGCHRYETVRHDFFGWLPKLSRRGVVLLHDVAEWRSDFGVWRLWNELRALYPSFLFAHAHGLGVLRVGPEAPEAVRRLVTLSGDGAARVRWWFGRLGERAASGAREGAESRRAGGRLSPEREILRDPSLAEPAAILGRIGRDPAWRLLGGIGVLSRRSRSLLIRASALAGELADVGLPSAGRWRALADLERVVESLLSSRSFRAFAPFATTSRDLAARLRDALRRSFRLFLPAAGAGEALPWRDSLGYALEIGGEKAAVRERYRRSLEEYLRADDRLRLPASSEPEISVVIVLYNQAELTYACLRSLAIHLAPPAEVILVDNASTDRTRELLERIDGARIFRNSENLHFLRAANQGAAAAGGRLLLFLNNDAQIVPGTVEAARKTIGSDPSVGAVGARIVNLDGRLQEAGSFLWGDGSPQGYGRGDSPLRRDYLFRREVDYGSGAFLLTRSSLFRELGGFDEIFAPAYFEESDYCVRLWESGRRVLYEPEAVVLHWEFGSSDRATAVKWLARNRKVFAQRHAAFLRGRETPRPGPIPVSIAPRPRVRWLYIEDRVPHPELGRGYPRSRAIVRELVALGARVTLFPMYDPTDGAEEWEEIYWSLPREVEVLRGMDASLLKAYLETCGGDFDGVWVSRPHNMARLLEAAGGKRLCGGAPIVYDAEALFALREIRAAAVRQGRALPEEEIRERVGREVALARNADRVVAVSQEEAREFRRQGIERVRVIGHALEPAPTTAPFEQRRDLLMVGAVEDERSPNGDALLWFVRRVLPRMRREWAGDPPRLWIVGHGTDSFGLRHRLGPEVVAVGPVADLTPYYEQARLFLAPTRFAAGIPHKAHEAAARGLPIVASELIAGQLGWKTGEELLSAPGEEEEAFSEACRTLYTDRPLWERVRAGALSAVARDCDPTRFSEAIRDLLGELAGRKKTD